MIANAAGSLFGDRERRRRFDRRGRLPRLRQQFVEPIARLLYDPLWPLERGPVAGEDVGCSRLGQPIHGRVVLVDSVGGTSFEVDLEGAGSKRFDERVTGEEDRRVLDRRLVAAVIDLVSGRLEGGELALADGNRSARIDRPGGVGIDQPPSPTDRIDLFVDDLGELLTVIAHRSRLVQDSGSYRLEIPFESRNRRLRDVNRGAGLPEDGQLTDVIAVDVGDEDVIDVGRVPIDFRQPVEQFRLARLARRTRVDQDRLRPLEQVRRDVFRRPRNVEFESMNSRERPVGRNGATGGVGRHRPEDCDPAA